MTAVVHAKDNLRHNRPLLFFYHEIKNMCLLKGGKSSLGMLKLATLEWTGGIKVSIEACNEEEPLIGAAGKGFTEILDA